MINGKFFTGLPPKMMDRATNGPNRQQSQLFWPDEYDVESASESQSKRRHNISQQTSLESNISCNTDIEPKKLFQKQLTSKIEFYDTADDSQLKSASKKCDDPFERQNKSQIFSSKIQFYDFDDGASIHIPKTDKNSKIDLERNSKNSPKTTDKRIKFVEEITAENGIPLPKGILRNNEVNTRATLGQDQSRKMLIKKRNISKSVENLSTRSRDFSGDEDDCINVIANDVKNIAINGHEIKEEDAGKNSGIKQSHFKDHFDHAMDNLEQIDENFYRKSGKDNAHVVYHEIQCESRDEKNVHSSKRNNRAGSPNTTSKIEPSGDCDTSSAFRPPTQDNITLNNDKCFRTEISVKSQNSSPHLKNFQPPSDQPVNNRAHRHLVSNITFGNDIEATTEKPPKSVRNSAVMRVSVGLPD